MVNKRDIGEVFSDSLQDFEQAPPNADKIWDGITSELELSQDNDKAAPIWWRGAGLGLLAIGLVATLLYFGQSWFLNNTNANQEQITTEQNIDGSQNPNNSNTQVVVADAADNDTEQNSIRDNVNNDLNQEALKNQEAVDESSPVISDQTIVATQNATTAATDSETVDIQKSRNANNNTVTASTNQNKNNSVVNTSQRSDAQDSNNTLKNQESALNKSGTTTARNSASKNIPARGYYVLRKSSLKKQGVKTTAFTVAPAPAKGELAQPLPVLGLTYGNIVKVKKSKALRALEREIRTREALDYKWTVGAVIAPTTYGSVTRGSMLDARLIDNPRQGETNLSYGIKIKNQFTPKSALRFGVNKINLGYNTQNFQVNVIDGIVNIYQLTGIDPGQEISEGISLNAQATEFFATNDVVGIDQQISYIEFPLEYEYAFINSRFGANLIGGSSLIVLNDNRIYATSEQGQDLEVGSASNLTGLGYTLNLGLGLDYEISKNIQFNVDPIFKLQLNGPNNTTTNNFRPYYFGIYSGLSFKF